MFFKPTAAKLGKRKTRILGVFTQVQGELETLMEEQAAYYKSVSLKIEELEAERSTVDKESTSTRKIWKKINEFLD